MSALANDGRLGLAIANTFCFWAELGKLAPRKQEFFLTSEHPISTPELDEVRAERGLRVRVRAVVEHPVFQNAIIWLIVINALILGVDCIPSLHDASPVNLRFVDQVILWVFVAEIALRLFAHRWAMLKDPWGLFDIAVVLVSVLAINSGISAFRAFRVFRILRLISAFPKMRTVVTALLDSIPGITSVGFLLTLILYVAAVMATNMFGAGAPELFGTLFRSMFTLFQILTLEGWVEVANDVMAVYPYAWVFFITFILVATFMVLNLFVAIVVSVLDHEDVQELQATVKKEQDDIEQETAALRVQVESLATQVARLADQLEAEKASKGDGN